MKFKSLDGESRAPTWADRERAAALREQGLEDVYVAPDDAPDEFWRIIDIATHNWLAGPGATGMWSDWEREVRFATGWAPFVKGGYDTYRDILLKGSFVVVSSPNNEWVQAGLAGRFTAIEILMDLASSDYHNEVGPFRAAVNDKAQWLQVAVRLDGNRFTPVTSEHLHQEVVQPALLLLNKPELTSVDGLYRKAFERVFAHDYPGAVTVATSAVEEMLRNGLQESGGQLKSLLGKARSAGWVTPAVEQFATKLQTLRNDSDAHTAGTDDHAVAMLAIHITGSLLIHLAETLPDARRRGAGA